MLAWASCALTSYRLYCPEETKALATEWRAVWKQTSSRSSIPASATPVHRHIWVHRWASLTANMLAREHIGITGYSGELLQNIDSQCAQVNDPALAILGQGYEQRLILPVHMFPFSE